MKCHYNIYDVAHLCMSQGSYQNTKTLHRVSSAGDWCLQAKVLKGDSVQ